jgi:hypothetical protein
MKITSPKTKIYKLGERPATLLLYPPESQMKSPGKEPGAQR